MEYISIELWLSFVLASAALIAIPGPTVMLVISLALKNGKSSGFATVPGVVLGDFTAMTLSLLGAGAVLATSSTLFTILKFVGAAYLIYLGVTIWRNKVEAIDLDVATKAVSIKNNENKSFKSMFWNSYIVTALNPKGIIFFVAFVPQFIDPTLPSFPQFALLEVSFLTLAGLSVVFWSLLVGRLRDFLSKPNSMRAANRCGALFLIGAGIITASLQQGR